MHSRTLCRVKCLEREIERERMREREKRRRRRRRERENVRWLVFLFLRHLLRRRLFLFLFLFLSPVRSSFQCRCWQQQQCSSSSHVNSEEYHHCSDLKNFAKYFSPLQFHCLTNSFTVCPHLVCLSVYDRRFPTCTYLHSCRANEFEPCPVKLHQPSRDHPHPNRTNHVY